MSATAAHGLADAAPVIAGARRLLLATHVNADGDTLGSMLALGLALSRLPDRAVTMVSPGDLPALYRFLPGSDRVLPALPDGVDAARAFDVGVVFDCDGLARVGEPLAAALARCPALVDVDHHPSPPFGTHWIHDTRAAATGELVYHLLGALSLPLEPDIATCLLTAIVTDTGRFLYGNVTSETFRIAAALLAAGARHTQVGEVLYQNRPLDTARLLGRALLGVKRAAEGRVAWALLTRRDFEEEAAEDVATEGLVNHLVGLAGVCVAALLREVEPEVTRVSLRSRCDVSVREIARRFGGGGHDRAAGCTLTGAADEAGETIERAMVAALAPGGGTA